MPEKNRKCLFIAIGAITLTAAVAVAIAVPLSQSSSNRDYTSDATALLESTLLIDGHNDWPYSFRTLFNNKISEVDLNSDLRVYSNYSHTDIPRMREGKLSGQFWSCFTACSSQHKDALRQALEQIDVIKRFVNDYPDTFQFAETADEIESAFANNKIASLIGVEGGHMIDSSMAALRMLYELGARYLTLTHSCDTPWAESASGNQTMGGLTEFGKSIVLEMNRLGILVDLAHVSTATMRNALEVSLAPIMFSHSSVRALCNIERNVPDDVLKTLLTNGGIIMINFFSNFVTCDDTATVADVADHFDYVKDLIGVDYIGVGADYDGVPRTPVGLEDVSKYPNLFAELMKRGWSDEDLKKVAGGNLLRVLRRVEEVAKEQQDQYPNEDWVPPGDVDGISCRTTY